MLTSTGVLPAVNRSLSQHIRFQFALILFLALFEPLRAVNDPWARKSAGEWDRADVHRILYDSPWSKHFTRTKRDLEFEVPELGPSGVELRGYHAKESKEDGAVTTEFYVRWVSSRTLRRAMARRTRLLKQMKPRSAETNIPPMLGDFEISIAGGDMSIFELVQDAKFKTRCYLVTNSKTKMRPTRVEFARSNEGKIRAILFHFPRSTASGEPLISSHEKKVWFLEAATQIEISVAFYPQSMVDEWGLDL